MAFWNDTSVEPKRGFRWLLYLEGAASTIPTYVIKVAKKPSFTVSNNTHQFIAHTFNYPGRITWNPVSVTMVDPVDPDASRKLVEVLMAAGYKIPSNFQSGKQSFSRANAVRAFGTPRLTQLNADGAQIEEWSLKNAWVESVDFGNLDYSSEEMVNVEMSIRYDWAEYRSYAGGSEEGPGHGPELGVVDVLTSGND